MTAVDGRPRSAPVSARTALAVAVAFALATAFLLDGAGLAAVGVAGALAVGWGIGALDGPRNRRTAAGSAALAVGSALLVVGVGAAVATGTTAYALVVAGTLAVSLAALAGVSADATDRLRHAVTESGFLIGAATLLAGAAYLVVGTGFAAWAAGWLLNWGTSNPIAAAWWLQVGVLVTGLLAAGATDVVRSWLPGSDEAAADGLAASFRLDRGDVPRWYLAALVVQLALAATTSVRSFVDSFLAARPLLGSAVDAVLLSGALHVFVAAVAGALFVVTLAPRAHSAVVLWTGKSPGDTLAFAAGGFLALAVAAVVSALALAGVAFAWLAPPTGSQSIFALVGPFAPVAAASLATLLAAAALVVVLRVAVANLDPTAGGFAVGSVALFLGTLLLADGLAAVAVVASAAASLLVWDLGVHALDVERDMRGVGVPARTEVVHASAVGLVLLGAVVVATAVGYLLVPVPLPGERATAALALVMLSVVAFAYAFRP